MTDYGPARYNYQRLWWLREERCHAIGGRGNFKNRKWQVVTRVRTQAKTYKRGWRGGSFCLCDLL